MIDFFNETICILLVIAITIIFLKTIYTQKKIDLITENFQSSPEYYGKLNESELAKRFSKHPEFIQKVNQYYKKEYNDGDLSKLFVDNISLLRKAKTARSQLLGIPEKYSTILDNYKELNDKYNNQKKKIENLLIKDFNTYEDLNKFNLKNIKMKKKLQDFTDSIKDINRHMNKYNAGKILKNLATSTEFTLIRNTNSGNLSQYGISSSIEEGGGEPIIYYFSLDGMCLQSDSKNNFLKIDCTSREIKQFFFIHQIKNNEMYNKYIKLSGNYEKEHLIETLDTTIEYPFFIISPFNIPGYAVLNIDKLIYIRPVRNDPFQRFVEVESSSFCEINN